MASPLEELQAKLKRSEEARQKLRASLVGARGASLSLGRLGRGGWAADPERPYCYAAAGLHCARAQYRRRLLGLCLLAGRALQQRRRASVRCSSNGGRGALHAALRGHSALLPSTCSRLPSCPPPFCRRC